MEFNSTLVGVIILLLIFIPVGYLIIHSAGKNKKIKQSLIDRSRTKSMDLKDIDIIGNLVIGIDTESRTLIYASKLNLANDCKTLYLGEVNSCRARSIKLDDKTLDWVGLEIIGKSGKLQIPFYTEIDASGLSKDPYVSLQDAKRWEATVRPMLKAS